MQIEPGIKAAEVGVAKPDCQESEAGRSCRVPAKEIVI